MVPCADASTSARRAGWACILADEDGDVIAGLYGPCPDAFPSSLRAELWAVIHILTLAVPPLTVWVDNKTVVDGWGKGPEWCCDSSRPAADLWQEFWRRIRDIDSEELYFKKCKGHATAGDVQAGRSTDFLRTGNDNADHFAGHGVDVATHQVPTAEAFDAYKRAISWYRWLAELASSWPSDTQVAPPSSSERPIATRPRPANAGFELHRERPHSLRQERGRLECQECGRFISLGSPQSLQRVLAKSECSSSIACRAAQATPMTRNSTQGGRAYGSAHVLLQTGALIWCRVCGAYAEHRLRDLLDDCEGPAGNGPRQSQLTCMLRRRHPRT